VLELARVLRPGGSLSCVEFHEPERPLLRAGWWAYTRLVMPLLGAAVSPAWRHTGRFLGPSISAFYARSPLPEQVRWWQAAGLRHVRTRTYSFGIGIVMHGVKPGRLRDG
jgi:demethylmenaquinone methyltransferase/2-methoxy-6-polyprenyl-1,4-benzoquinol methylase